MSAHAHGPGFCFALVKSGLQSTWNLNEHSWTCASHSELSPTGELLLHSFTTLFF